MSTENQAFLDYYKSQNISPVAQDISDFKKHLQRRDSLYRQCGIAPALIKGKAVLEVGPGTGHNALYTNYLKPERYVLLDGNPKSVEETKKNLTNCFKTLNNVIVIERDFLSFSSKEKFDLVCCEGTIPWQNDPKTFLQHLSTFVDSEGLLLITCSDSVSYLSEVLRRLLAKLIYVEHIQKGNNFSFISNETLILLRPFFTEHLSHLKGMSRSVDDWVHDNILQPIVGQPLSMIEAINALKDDFDIYGSSPKILTDWRWYKDIQGNGRDFNTRSIADISSNTHNLLDFRALYEKQPVKLGSTINQLTDEIMLSIFALDKFDGEDLLNSLVEQVPGIIKRLDELKELVRTYSGVTELAIIECIDRLSAWQLNRSFEKEMPNFSCWYGRGQQYLSFIKKPWFER